MFLRQDQKDWTVRLRADNVTSVSRRARYQRVFNAGSVSIPALVSALVPALLTGMVLSAALPAHAQLKARVDVDPGKAGPTIYTTSLGVSPERWDGKAYDSATLDLIQDAGITSVRFPGNGGTDALYHWSTGELTNPYANDHLAVFPPERKFPSVSAVIDKLGSALITVNYGSNLDGSGGGEPAEAAAWVAYVNGSPDNTLTIGKDSKGNDWKTVGYWAGLRAADPLPTDDGKNFLRLGHSSSFGIQLWTIGNEPWNDGFYGQDKTVGEDADVTGLYGQSYPVEPDLHAGGVPTAKDWGRHAQNSKIGPGAYGAAVVEFAKAMKAVDPTIFVGAALTQPPISDSPNPMGKNWNATVLKAACGSMDFAAVTFIEGKGAPPDWVLLDEHDLLVYERYPMDDQKFYNLDAIDQDYALLANDLGTNYKKFCPSGHFPQLAVTNLGISGWLPPKNPASEGIFAAEAITKFLESGAYTVEWGSIHAASATFLDKDNKPAPVYYGIKMIHSVAGPGDTFVGTTINGTVQDDALRVHAFKRRDGGLSLLFINKAIDRSITTTVSIAGYNYATKGTRYDYGKATADANKGIVESPIDNLGATFTVEVPRYGITGIVIPAKAAQ